MINQFILLGKIKNIENIKDNKAIATIEVKRNYKNMNGKFESDLIDIVLTSTIGQNTIKYCQNGDMIGAKGRIENLDNKIVLIADKVSFLAKSRN